MERVARSSHARPRRLHPELHEARAGRGNISIATGFLLADGTATIAKKFPKSNFAIVDYSVHAPPFANKAGKPLFKNVVGLTFATKENSYMIGCLAALMAKRAGGEDDQRRRRDQDPRPSRSSSPPTQQAPRSASRGRRRSRITPKNFVDQAKCKELALNQIARGSKVVFAVAGGCGLGALDAAKEKKVWGVGVDKDQAYLGKHILTSAVKRVDTAVKGVIQAQSIGVYPGGTDINFNLGRTAASPSARSGRQRCGASYISKMNALGLQIEQRHDQATGEVAHSEHAVPRGRAQCPPSFCSGTTSRRP